MPKIERISVTRALVQLKLTEKKIQKQVNAKSAFCSTTKNREAASEVLQAEANLQSINDLAAYYNRLKTAIATSNATTYVNVAGEEMLVIEAIERKRNIGTKVRLLNRLRQDFTNSQNEIEEENARAEERLDRILEANFGKDSKTREGEMNQITEMFWKENQTKLDDPINISKVIEELDNEIDNFEAEVDLVLSESNAQTFIEI